MLTSIALQPPNLEPISQQYKQRQVIRESIDKNRQNVIKTFRKNRIVIQLGLANGSSLWMEPTGVVMPETITEFTGN